MPRGTTAVEFKAAKEKAKLSAGAAWPDHATIDRTRGWTDEQWAGRARMARTREACNIPLDDVDKMAIMRTAGAAAEPHTTFQFMEEEPF